MVGKGHIWDWPHHAVHLLPILVLVQPHTSPFRSAYLLACILYNVLCQQRDMFGITRCVVWRYIECASEMEMMILIVSSGWLWYLGLTTVVYSLTPCYLLIKKSLTTHWRWHWVLSIFVMLAGGFVIWCGWPSVATEDFSIIIDEHISQD